MREPQNGVDKATWPEDFQLRRETAQLYEHMNALTHDILSGKVKCGHCGGKIDGRSFSFDLNELCGVLTNIEERNHDVNKIEAHIRQLEWAYMMSDGKTVLDTVRRMVGWTIDMLPSDPQLWMRHKLERRLGEIEGEANSIRRQLKQALPTERAWEKRKETLLDKFMDESA
jgi:hypothetical protein